MQLSIIIVNYNVKYFLEQCLCSVEKAIKNIEAEVWIADNASVDGSVEYLQSRFPFAKFIVNNENIGFGKANNNALKQASGEYILFLNPDTIVPEDCFEQCIAFLNSYPQAGALGTRMIDGSGDFLPESKRSFPTPVTSLFKLVGLTSLFPKSKLFAGYSLGYLNEFESNEVDVLAGAFMLIRKEILAKLSGFDETFFMYGEDVDLSYRIQKLGYKNYYFPGTGIIHFKGESTKKGSLNYVRMFYQAMSIFVKKHYGQGKANIFSTFIQIAIWLRAGFSAVGNFLFKIGLPLFDAVIIFCAFELVNYTWIKYIRNGYGFRTEIVNIALPGFTLVFLLAATLAGIYDNKYKPLKAIYAALVAIVVMLAVYSLLPERYRFSRGVILGGGFAALLFITFFRWLLLQWRFVKNDDESNREQQTLIVGTKEEYEKVVSLLVRAGYGERVIGRIAVNGDNENTIGTLAQLPGVLSSVRLKEVIFCEGHLSFKEIIHHLQQLPGNINARFHARCSESVVGSESKDTAGEFLSMEGDYKLADPYQKRMKRIVDISIALFILLTFPMQVFIAGIAILSDAVLVLSGKKTWVGYSALNKRLPPLATGVLFTNGYHSRSLSPFTVENLNSIDTWYAKTYDWLQDVKLIVRYYRRLGGRTALNSYK